MSQSSSLYPALCPPTLWKLNRGRRHIPLRRAYPLCMFHCQQWRSPNSGLRMRYYCYQLADFFSSPLFSVSLRWWFHRHHHGRDYSYSYSYSYNCYHSYCCCCSDHSYFLTFPYSCRSWRFCSSELRGNRCWKDLLIWGLRLPV